MTELKQLVDDFNQTSDLKERIKIANKYNEILLANVCFEYDKSLPTPEIEVWRNVIGWEGIYQISNFGRIKAIERFLIKNRRGGKNKMAVYQVEVLRTIKTNRKGYKTISLWKEGFVKHFTTHRLVAIHYIANPNKYPQVLHKDDNPANPRWGNLFWGTQSQNIQDSVSKGRWRIGAKNNKTKLLAEQVVEIKKLILSGRSCYGLGKQYNMSKYAILSIKNGRSWAYIKI